MRLIERERERAAFGNDGKAALKSVDRARMAGQPVEDKGLSGLEVDLRTLKSLLMLFYSISHQDKTTRVSLMGLRGNPSAQKLKDGFVPEH